MIQLREKDLTASHLLPLAECMREITSGKALLFINDRVDIALAVGADGAHLSGDSMPISTARRISGNQFMISKSIHDPDEGLVAEEDGADLLVAGTIFASKSHPCTVPKGVGILKKLAGKVTVPFLAIGGISKENAHLAIESGAAGVAAISSITESADPNDAARNLVSAVKKV